MATSEDIRNQIGTLATSPMKVSGDSGSVEMPKIQDVIAAEQHFAGKTGITKPHRGIYLSKIRPSGAH